MFDSKTQYSIGEQGFEKKVFWALGMGTCPRCEINSIVSQLDCCGIRRNGDAYGVAVFTCLRCDFKTSFHYDDAADRYYYDVIDWSLINIINKWEETNINT